MRSALAEGISRTVTLIDVSPCIFEIFAEWLYTRQLPLSDQFCAHCLEDRDHDDGEVGYEEGDEDYYSRKEAHQLVRVYILADRLFVQGLKIEVVQRLVVFVNETSFKHKTVAPAFGNLPADSPLLDFMVHAYCTRTRNADIQCEVKHGLDIDKLPMDFLRRATIKYAALTPAKTSPMSITNYDGAVDSEEDQEREGPVTKRRKMGH